MKKTLCKLLSAAAALVLTAAAALPIGKIGRVEAATKRTAVVASLLTARGKINTADWNALGDYFQNSDRQQRKGVQGIGRALARLSDRRL